MNGHTPFFSVVIPTLNEEKYKDFEAFVVDGRSEDKTVEKAKKYEGVLPYLEIMISDIRNVGAQRNKAAKAARGKFLVFLDADAQIPANFLSQIHNYLIEEDPKCRFLTTWVKADSESSSEKTVTMFINMLLEMAKSMEKPTVLGFNMVVLRKDFEKVKGFNEKIKIAEDFDLTKRLTDIGASWHLLKSPRLVMSLRRLRREGTLESVRKLVVGVSKFLLEGPITQEIFDYPMGGKVVDTRSKRRQKLKKTFEKYKKLLDQF